MKKTKVIILGGGIGGVYPALRLDKTLALPADVEVTLVSSNNFLLFTPGRVPADPFARECCREPSSGGA